MLIKRLYVCRCVSCFKNSNNGPPLSKVAAENPEKKTKAKQDPNAPKRPLPAYMIYSKTVRPQIAKEHPELASKVVEVAKIIGERWAALSDAKKAPYQKEAEKDKARYEKESESYKGVSYWLAFYPSHSQHTSY